MPKIRARFEQLVAARLWPRLGQITLRRRSALGDELFLTAVAREIRRHRPSTRITIECSHPELFAANPHVDRVVTARRRLDPVLFHLSYEPAFEVDRRSSRHVVELLCEQVGVPCTDTRPEVFLTTAEKTRAAELRSRYGDYVTLSTQTSDWSPNKLWHNERWQQVVEQLSGRYVVLQLGLADEPELHGVVRLAGTTSVRDCFAVLSGARAHLGAVSFLKHAAQAVGTPAVAVYGGYEAPSTSSYRGDEALYTPVECAPCWLRDGCPHGRKCMTAITAENVTAALARVASRRGDAR